MHDRLPAFPEALNGSRILVVDDIPVNRLLLCATLCGAGLFNLREAEDGEEALLITAAWRPHLILLDIMMPHMSGDEVCAALTRETSKLRPVIIVQTALTDDITREELFALGADDYLTKPIDPLDLVIRCRLHLDRRWGTRPSCRGHSVPPGSTI